VTPAATDDRGRPIVAELGRAETPEETADRKAAASAKRRSNQTAINLVIALVASLGVVLLIVLVVVRPNVSQLPHVDYAAVAADAQGAVDTELVVPVLPPDWWANRAELNTRAADDVATWEIGFITPSQQYIAFTQGIDTNPTWVAGKVANAPSSGSQTIEGVTWEVYDRRDADDPGNLAYALVTTFEGSTFVLSGTASEQEFATLAASITAELES